MPERLFHPQNPDIRHLTTERPKTDFVLFDIKRDFTGDDWNFGLSELERHRVDNAWEAYIKDAYVMKLLAPDRSDELPLNEEAWQKVSAEVKNLALRALPAATRILCWLKSLFPNRAHELPVNRVTVVSLHRIQEWSGSQFRIQLLEEMAYFRLTFPSLWQRAIVPEIDKEWLDSVVQEIKNDTTLADKDSAMRLSVPPLVHLRIVSPDHLSRIITEELQEDMRHFFLSTKRSADHFDMFSYMAILAADSLRFADTGLELTFANNTAAASQTDALPAERKY